ARKTKIAEQVIDSIAAYRKYKAENIEKATTVLGPKLVQSLNRFASPKGFDKAVGELRQILDGSLDVTELKRLAPPTRILLESLGVDSRHIPTGLHRPRGKANTAPVGNSIEEQLARMGDE